MSDGSDNRQEYRFVQPLLDLVRARHARRAADAPAPAPDRPSAASGHEQGPADAAAAAEPSAGARSATQAREEGEARARVAHAAVCGPSSAASDDAVDGASGGASGGAFDTAFDDGRGARRTGDGSRAAGRDLDCGAHESVSRTRAGERETATAATTATRSIAFLSPPRRDAPASVDGRAGIRGDVTESAGEAEAAKRIAQRLRLDDLEARWRAREF